MDHRKEYDFTGIDITQESPADLFLQMPLSNAADKTAKHAHEHHKKNLEEKSSFLLNNHVINVAANRAQVIGHARPSRYHGNHRRRPDINAMVRGSMGSRYSSCSNFGLSATKNTQGKAVEVVPILGDCSFDQKYRMQASQSGPMEEMSGIAKLEALRDVMGRISDAHGLVDRETFSAAFDVDKRDVEEYHVGNGMVNGNALLIDAMLDLDVGVEEKLRFIFDTVDANNAGVILEDQLLGLLSDNFSHEKLDVIGMELPDIVKLMFRRAGVEEGKGMSFDRFKQVFNGFIVNSYGSNVKEKKDPTFLAPAVRNKSIFDRWYELNRLRFWWLLIYFILNNVAFWLKWFTYDVDPAMKYGLRVARACAQVIMLNCFFVLLPMCRSITAVMKRSRLLWKYIPFDDHIEFHKICGVTLLTSGFIHAGAHVSNEIYLYILATPEEIHHTIFVQRHIWKELPPFYDMMMSLPIITGCFLLLIACISFPLATIPRFRQGRFNLFWYSHMLLGPFLIVMCFHGALSWLAQSQSYMWIAPPFMVYLVERRYRYAKTFAAPVRIMDAQELDKTVALYMEKPKRFNYRPGMYLYINCPAISTHEWHPFTISSAPGDNYISVHIRNAGDWTGALHKIIAECHKNKSQYPEVYLDGPVGAPTQEYHRFKTIVCIAGGIGVTPFASILKDVVNLWEDHKCERCNHVRHPNSFKIKKLHFYWTTRAQESLGWFESTMNQIASMDRDHIIEAHQYLTSVKESENSSQLRMFQQFVHQETGRDFVTGMKTRHLTHFGRPDWEKIFLQIRDKHPGEEIGVFFCGPHALDKALSETCQKFSQSHAGGTYFDYHSEKFA